MRIAFIVFDYTKPGGIERYVRILSEIFSKNGNEVHIFSSEIPKNKIENIAFHKIVLPKTFFFLQLYLFSHQVTWLIKKFNFDIIHNQGTDGLIQDVLTAHSCHRAWVEYAKKSSVIEFLKKQFNPLHWVILRNEKHNFSVGNYKKIIAVSENVKQEIIFYYHLSPEDIEVIFPGVDLDEFNPKNKIFWRNKIRNDCSLLQEDFVILFVANEFRRKGLWILLKSLKRIENPKVKLLVVGKDNKLPYLLLAKRLNLIDRIIFVPQTEYINRYYACADIFVLPTKYEPAGLVTMEAMASGLPVLVSKIAGTSILLDDERCILNNPLDENEIAEKIGFLLENSNYCEELGIKLQNKIGNYTWEKVTDQTFEIYKKVREEKNKCS